MCLISLDKALIKAPWRTQRQNFHTFWSRRYKVVKSSKTSQTHLTGYYVAYTLNQCSSALYLYSES